MPLKDVIQEDDFNDINGTLLDDHQPDIGDKWNPISGLNTIEIQNGSSLQKPFENVIFYQAKPEPLGIKNWRMTYVYNESARPLIELEADNVFLDAYIFEWEFKTVIPADEATGDITIRVRKNSILQATFVLTNGAARGTTYNIALIQEVIDFDGGTNDEVIQYLCFNSVLGDFVARHSIVQGSGASYEFRSRLKWPTETLTETDKIEFFRKEAFDEPLIQEPFELLLPGGISGSFGGGGAAGGAGGGTGGGGSGAGANAAITDIFGSDGAGAIDTTNGDAPFVGYYSACFNPAILFGDGNVAVGANVLFSSLSDPGMEIGLIGRNDNISNNHYYLLLDDTKKLRLGKRINNIDADIVSTAISGLMINTWYALILEMDGNTLRGYLNGELLLQTVDLSFVESVEGCQGWRIDRSNLGTNLVVDNFLIWDLTVDINIGEKMSMKDGLSVIKDGTDRFFGVVETFNTSEAVLNLPDLSFFLAEILVMTDDVSPILSFLKEIQETFTMTDNVTLAALIPIVEQLGLSDQITLKISIAIAETFTATDQIKAIRELKETLLMVDNIDAILKNLTDDKTKEGMSMKDSVMVSKSDPGAQMVEADTLFFSDNKIFFTAE